MKANAPNELIDQITVQVRSLRWTSLVDNEQAVGGEVDACLDPTDAGRAVGSQCIFLPIRMPPLDQGAPTNHFQFWRHLTGIGFDTFNIVVH